MGKPLSSEAKVVCDCCGNLKACRMYITFMGSAWICKECRNGKAR